MGVQLLWFCVILCYIWQNLAGLKPQLIIWFFEREEKNMAVLLSQSVLRMMAEAPSLTPSKERLSQEAFVKKHLAALRGCDGEGGFERRCLWMPSLSSPSAPSACLITFCWFKTIQASVLLSPHPWPRLPFQLSQEPPASTPAML